ncbi:hypothetical protein PsYK624_003730 [Phanerochaete sordida]|uniref:Uncharacterized protein n=1 Tax=Phanerochaete sordida TaxID=48140 RepID=A0A9P3L841_9APHY|nr:hypothetical protein PsYK624_003730 [Phanerochaete sordida]
MPLIKDGLRASCAAARGFVTALRELRPVRSRAPTSAVQASGMPSRDRIFHSLPGIYGSAARMLIRSNLRTKMRATR